MLDVRQAAGFAAPAPLPSLPAPTAYEPGTCNIGPDEIARRRRSGHVGALVTAALFVVLVAIGAPPIARLFLAIPATVSAAGYLQARARFCAAYGALGVFNLGPLGATESVADVDSRARDRAKATRIGLGSFIVGLAVGLAAALLPV